MYRHILISTLSTAILLSTPFAYAQSTLPTITVRADKSDSLTVPNNIEAKDIIQQRPGGAAVIPNTSFADKAAVNFRDTLGMVPGVYAQTRYAEESRLSIRGSGLSRGFHLRGLQLLQDAIPYNLADGSGDFQEADPLSYQRLEVFKGGNALEYGAATLGGAINMVTHTGHSQPGNQARMEIGADDFYRLNTQIGRAQDKYDYFLNVTGTTAESFRQHEERENLKFNGNVGVKLTDTTEGRVYFSQNIIEQKLASTLTREQALNSPEIAGANTVLRDAARDIRSTRLAAKTSTRFGQIGQWNTGFFMNLKDLYHPLTFGIVDQDSGDYGVFTETKASFTTFGLDNRFKVGLINQWGHIDAKVYANNNGSRGGNPTADADQDAVNLSLYGENHLYVLDDLALVMGGQLSWNERTVSDTLTPAKSDAKIYRAFNPKVGVLYEVTPTLQFFANVSRAHEAPTFSELTQSGTGGFTPLNAQRSITAEIGKRGSHGRFAFDLSLYHARVRDEMLQYTVTTGIPASTFNADKTVHQGVELGLTVDLGENWLTDGDTLSWQNAYTFSDYYFDGDAQYGQNTIAGQPAHYYKAALAYTHPSGLRLTPNTEWVPVGAEVDFANTQDTPGYILFGLESSYDVSQSMTLFMDARNLTDQDYIATFSTTTRAATTSNALFYPGEGRSLYVGARIKFY
jgi:iron complex outermembrane recepter protein